jgi:hypothetical protein
MNKVLVSKDSIMPAVKQEQARMRKRVLLESDVDRFIRYVNSGQYNFVRVYSTEGFVANCYCGNARIARLTWSEKETGAYCVVDLPSARRPNGRGETTHVKERRGRVSVA